MAAGRIWFPNAPVSIISASDRAQIGIGYGLLVIDDEWKTQQPASDTWVRQT